MAVIKHTEKIVEVKMEDNRSEKIPEMLTIKEVSEHTGMSYETIRKFCLKHEIVYIKTGWKNRKETGLYRPQQDHMLTKYT